MTVAHEIKSPFKRKSKFFPEGYRNTLVTIWHVDPEKDGIDDSCGWFKRAHHGDKAMLSKIEKAIEFDFDRTFTPDDEDEESGKRTYFTGLFKPNGDPNLSVIGITLDLFFSAIHTYYDHDWKKARKWMNKHLFEILHFAENPTDSLHDGITRKFQKGCGEEYTERARKERIHNLAATIYGWILRKEQKWWKHPRWHIHHWKIQVRFIDNLKRFLFSRCCKCGKHFPWGYSVCTNSWNCTGPRWFRSEKDVYHSDCLNPENNCCANSVKTPAP